MDPPTLRWTACQGLRATLLLQIHPRPNSYALLCRPCYFYTAQQRVSQTPRVSGSLVSWILRFPDPLWKRKNLIGRKWEQEECVAVNGSKRAFRRARVFLFVSLWVCGFVGLWGCGVVGLWGCGVCVCVCFIGRVGPKKLQKSASFANFYQNRTKIGPKSTTNGTNLGQGGGKGQPKINENMKKYKKRKRKEAK